MAPARKSLLAILIVSIGVIFTLPIKACSLIPFDDNGRYVGGDLTAQIAARANTIQIVRVTGRHRVSRIYSEGEWYLLYGTEDVPKNRPEFIDEYAFEFSVVETLKGGRPPGAPVYENSLRIRGYDAAELLAASSEAPPAGAKRPHPNSLPDWVLDRPGNDKYEFTGGAAADSGLGAGECNGPYLLGVGQTFVAFRDPLGRLYPMVGAFPLTIDAEFLERHRKTRASFNMQSLVPIIGATDPLLLRLRTALSHRAP